LISQEYSDLTNKLHDLEKKESELRDLMASSSDCNRDASPPFESICSLHNMDDTSQHAISGILSCLPKQKKKLNLTVKLKDFIATFINFQAMKAYPPDLL